MQEQNDDYPGDWAAQNNSTEEAVNLLLSNERIKEIIEKNQFLEEKIKRAAELLVNTLDPISALLVAAKAIRKDKINVFVSYKKQDEDAARTVVSELRKFGGRHLDIEYMAEFSESAVGEDFNKKIRDCIQKAHWFILLLPDPSVDWDWCLFETGMFRGRMLDGVHKLFCLHHPHQTQLPPQINEFQSVCAEPNPMKGLLKKLFKHKDPIPGMDSISPFIDEHLMEVADNIIKAIKPRCQRLNRKVLSKYVLLDTRNLKNPETYDNQEGIIKDMGEMEILETDSDTLSMFGMIEKPKCWAELVKHIASSDINDTRWLREIHASIIKVLMGEAYGPIQATLKGMNSGKIWQPHLTAIYRTNYGRIESILIIFVEEVSAGLTAHIPPTSLALITVLRLTYRFRWEILKRYTYTLSVNDINELKDSLDRIETEARSRGLMDKEKVLELFCSDTEAAKRVSLMFDTWARIRNDQRTGELDLAIKQADTEKIKSILISVSKTNQEFLELAIGRMEPLLAAI